MIAVKTADVRNNFRDVCKKVLKGNPVFIPRPKNENVVLISEKEYRKWEVLKSNVEYDKKIKDALDSIYSKNKAVTFSMEELEEFETLNPKETINALKQKSV